MAGQEETKDDAPAEKAYDAAAAKTPVVPLKANSDVKAAGDVKVGDAKASASKSAASSSAPLPGLPQPGSKPLAMSTPLKPVAGKGVAKVKATKPVQATARVPAVEQIAAPALKAPAVKAPVVKTPAAASNVAAPKPMAPAAAMPVQAAKPAQAQKVSSPLPPAQADKTAASNTPVSLVAPVATRPDNKVAQEGDALAASPSATAGKAAETVEAKTITFAGLFNPFILEEKTMDISSNFAGFQGAVTEAQAKAKAAFEKSSVAFGEAGDFAKGNVEAVIESSKIFAEGLQGIGSELVAESRTAFETFTGDIKELAAAKSPTDFFKLQGDILRKNFDSAVAYGSKNSEAALKLFSDTVAPISGRVSVAVEKARNVAA